MPNLYDEYARLNDPNRIKQDIGTQFNLAQPQLQALLAGMRSDLSRRGMFSESPLATASARTVGGFSNQIASNYYSGLEDRRMQLMQMIAEMEQRERERKSQQRSGLFGGIGSLLGTIGSSFIPGGGLLRSLMSGLNGGGGYSNLQAPSLRP
jgi:hypothetical protein